VHIGPIYSSRDNMDILKRLKLLKSITLHSRLFQAVTTLSPKVFTNIQTRITWVYLNSDISVNRTDQCPYVTYLNVSRVACSSSISSRSLVAVRRDLQELTHHRLVLARLRQQHWRNITLKIVVTSGVARILCQGGTTIETPKARASRCQRRLVG